jgi:predicted helicase
VKIAQTSAGPPSLTISDLSRFLDPQTLAFMTEANTARVERQNRTPITIIIGNPPYNQSQQDENDKNKNRKYAVIDHRISETYIKESTSTLTMQVYDPYIKFFRWATDRLQGRDGIVCMVTNNSFVDQIAFDGVRKHFYQDFSCIYHVDLHGNVRKNPKLSGTTHNVFGIQVGVGITVAVRSSKHKDHRLFYHRVPEDMRREEKLKWLTERQTVSRIEWQSLIPDSRNNWLIPENAVEFDQFMPLGTKASKATSSASAGTNSDAYVYDFDREILATRTAAMIESFNAELDRWKRMGCPKNLDEFIKVDEKVLKWIRNTKRSLLRGRYIAFDDTKIRLGLYRPFSKRQYCFERSFNEDLYRLPTFLPTAASQSENRIIVTSDIGFRASSFSVLVTDAIPERHLCASTDAHQCFPLYVYDEDGSNRRENITD